MEVKSAILFLEKHGCEVLKPKHKNANGPDLNIIKNDEAFRVEIKQVRKIKSGSWQTDAVSMPRQNDDFILIMNKGQVVEFSSMKDHLKLCCESGQRILTNVMKIRSGLK